MMVEMVVKQLLDIVQKEVVVNIQTINDLPQISLGNESLIVEKSIGLNQMVYYL